MAPPTARASKRKKVEKKKKTPASLNGAQWGYSEARKKIAQDIINGFIPSTGKINVNEIFHSRYANNPLFKDFPYQEDLYKSQIDSL